LVKSNRNKEEEKDPPLYCILEIALTLTPRRYTKSRGESNYVTLNEAREIGVMFAEKNEEREVTRMITWRGKNRIRRSLEGEDALEGFSRSQDQP